MKRRTRIYYTQTQKTLMWDRWQRGDTMHDIARLFDRGHSSVQRILTENGGIRPRERKRASPSQREKSSPEAWQVSYQCAQ